MKEVLYVYGIVRDDFDVSRCPSGIDDAAITLAKRDTLAALVSRLPATEYAAPEIETNSGDVGWLSPRALSHDRVLTWAQDHGGVIPLPMFSMWGSHAALDRSLTTHAKRLVRAFDRVSGADEYGVRIHRRDAAMLESIDQLDPRMAELKAEASAASPGQRYLLERKFADQSKMAIRGASQRMAKQIFDDLSRLARESIARPLVPSKAGAERVDATLVLNGAFLVDRGRLEDFRVLVGKNVREHEPRGLAFDFTGPWPPYNFVAENGAAALEDDGGR